jgi:N6-L-threonylcarbamoyladenine synthase
VTLSEMGYAPRSMLVLGIETSCDETGVALYDSARGLLAHEVHTQAALHAEYGGVVPELASRDHIRRTLPLVRRVLERGGARLDQVDAVAYTEGPGLAGALLVGASIAAGLAYGLGVPAIGVHHLEGHLLSPLLSKSPPTFPFVALLVSGGHTQLMEVEGVGRYRLLGETLDDAAGEAFDKTAQVLGLGYPGGPALAQLADRGQRGRHRLPRPMIASGDLEFSFSGLKTAVLTLVRNTALDAAAKADVAAEFQEAVVDVLVAKCRAALEATGHRRLVIAGGVGANRRLRERLDATAKADGFAVYYPELELCTDNGAMIALAGALRLQSSAPRGYAFTVRPRWDLAQLTAAG